MPADFLLGLANSFAYDLLKAGGNRLRDRIQGDAQTRALRRVYSVAFKALLSEIGDGLSEADVETLAEHAFRPFLNRPDVVTALLDVALLQRDLDLPSLHTQFESARQPDALHNLRFDQAAFERGMSEFQRALAQTLRDEVRTPESPLFNLSTDHKLDELLVEVRRRDVAPHHPNGPAAVDAPTLDAARARFAALPTDEVPAVASLPTGSHLPYTANSLFTGREGDLLALARLVKGESATTEVQAIVGQAAVTGMGGVGKTQLAAAFAHRYGQFFHAVHWLSLADPNAVPAAIARCGDAMAEMATGYSSLPLAEQVRLVLQQWQEPLPRLLIFDNCETAELLAAWRPSSGGCRLLLTSRRSTRLPTSWVICRWRCTWRAAISPACATMCRPRATCTPCASSPCSTIPRWPMRSRRATCCPPRTTATWATPLP